MTRQEMKEFAQKQVEFTTKQIAFAKSQIEWVNKELARTRKEDREQKEFGLTYENGKYAHLYEGNYQSKETKKLLNERRRWQRDLKHNEASLVKWQNDVIKYTDPEDEIKEEETMTTATETKATVTVTDTIPTTTNNMKEEDTMEIKTIENIKINLTTGEITFQYNGSTYTHKDETAYYYKTSSIGKKVRISGKEWAEAHDALVAKEQAKLDEKPCRIEVNSDLHVPAVLNEFGCVDCSKCNVTGCVHRDCMRRNPRSEGGLGECPRLDVKPIVIEEKLDDPELEQIIDETGLEPADAELERNIRKEKKAKKSPSKPRRSKDIAYEANGMTLTAKQVDFIKHLPDTDYWEKGLDSCIWTDILCDQIGGQFADKPMTVGAMISTLCEKGLGVRGKEKMNGRKATFFELTEMGKKVAGDLGLA